MSIPISFKGLLKYNVTVHTYHNHTFTWSFNPCSYTFLVEEGSFNFSTADLIDLQKIDKVSTVLDWAVGNQTCEEAQKNSTSYACKENSNCTKSDNGPGYRCYCSVGYRGPQWLLWYILTLAPLLLLNLDLIYLLLGWNTFLINSFWASGLLQMLTSVKIQNSTTAPTAVLTL